MIAATLFSGIGAPEAAMPEWHWPWHAEIEKFPSAVMVARHPESVNLGDVNAGDFCDRAAAIARPDVLVFGSPCQSYSVAGKRLGLDDPRGNLALVALGIVGQLAPRWFVFENVPGLLSSSEGRDFGLFLRAVDELGYSGAWASLDAQWFGVAQRRKRLFFVGHLGNWRGPAAVLLEPESVCGDYPPRRQAGEGTAPTIASRPTGGGGLGTDFDCDGGPHGRLDFESETFVAHALRADGFDASEDGTGRVTPLVAFQANAGRDFTSDEERSPPLRSAGIGGVGGVAIAFDARQSDVIQYGDMAGPLDTDGHSMAVAYGLRSDAGREGAAKTPSPDAEGRVRLRDPGFNAYEELAPTIDAGQPHSVAVAFMENQRGELRVSEQTDSLKTGGGKPGQGYPAVAVALRGRDGGATAELSDVPSALRASQGGGDKAHVLTSAVRRLTPRECERLQGFPDDYTLVSYRGKPAASGPRYKALGNSMAVPVLRWILQRIEAVEREQGRQP